MAQVLADSYYLRTADTARPNGFQASGFVVQGGRSDAIPP